VARTIKIGSYSWTLPDWAPARIAIGLLLILCGFLGFLPILGFWMIPLGVAVLSYDIPRVRLLRQKLMAWWRGGKSTKTDDTAV
jgi:voltage-gated potassium channel Kch